LKAKSIFLKLFFLFLTSAMLTAAFFVVLNSRNIKKNNIEIFTRELTASAKIMRLSIISLLKSAPGGDVDAFVKKSAEGSGTRITVVLKDGVVVADSEASIHNIGSHLSRSEIDAALSSNSPASAIRRSNTLNTDLLYVAVPLVERDNVPFAVLRLSVPLKGITALSYEFISKNYAAFFAVALFAGMLSFFISRYFGKKVEELSLAFEELARGNFNIRLDIQTNDELGRLAGTFNEMSGQMGETFKKLSASSDELNKIINSVSDGIMVTGSNGKILLTNPSFEKFFPYKRQSETFYWQAVTGKFFAEHMARAGETGAQFVFERMQKHYLCTIAPIEQGKGFVTVFCDISGMKNLESFKKDLVSNVSHELKTPLASIQAYTEFLETETDPAQIKNYAAVISRNTARLSNIVNDLLTLSEIEHKETLNIEEFDFTEITGEMSDMFGARAKAKNINLVFDCPQGVKVKADKFRLSQALLNIIDNALRYTETGGITVSAACGGGNITVTVADTGAGIPSEHMGKIFNRFHVADKSRSRKTGGTGLGLSIVKHIVSLHGGAVSVESAVGKGSVFKIVLPQ